MATEKTMVGNFVAQTGITYRDLAGFLQVSHALLHMHESKLRDLPTNALLQLAHAQKTITAQANKAARATPQKPAATSKTGIFMKKEAQWCVARCSPLQKKLAAMQQRYRQGAAALTLLEVMAKAAENQTEKKQRWITIQYDQAQQKMKTNDWLAQKKIELAISRLQHDANFWQNA